MGQGQKTAHNLHVTNYKVREGEPYSVLKLCWNDCLDWNILSYSKELPLLLAMIWVQQGGSWWSATPEKNAFLFHAFESNKLTYFLWISWLWLYSTCMISPLVAENSKILFLTWWRAAIDKQWQYLGLWDLSNISDRLFLQEGPKAVWDVNKPHKKLGKDYKINGHYYLVLVKCRQNVANKLFITRIFNPIHPHNCNLTVLSALLCSEDYWTLSYAQKKSRQALSLFWGTESTYNTVVVDVASAVSVGCVAQLQVRPCLDSLAFNSPRLTNWPFLRLSCTNIKF